MAPPSSSSTRVDVALAVELVGPCQDAIILRLLDDHTTVAARSGVVFGLLSTPGFIASQATRSWAVLARQAHDGDAAAISAALEGIQAMSEEDLDDLLQDALDHWAASGADVRVVTPDTPPEMERTAFMLGVFTIDTPNGPLPGLALTPEAGLESMSFSLV